MYAARNRLKWPHKLFNVTLPVFLIGTLLPLCLVLAIRTPAEAGCPCSNFDLTLDISPKNSGAIILNQSVPSSFPDVSGYEPDTVISIEAVPASGYIFKGWQGDLEGRENPVSIVIDSNKKITAEFTPITHNLNVQIEGRGFTEPKTGIHHFTDGSIVAISATPEKGWRFDKWVGDVAEPTEANTTIKLDSAKTVTANFSQDRSGWLFAGIIILILIVMGIYLIFKKCSRTIGICSEKVRDLFLHPFTSLFSRLVLGGIFIFAGVVKLPSIENLVWEIGQYQILPDFLATAYGYTLPFLEIILGMLLMLGIFLRIGAGVSGLLLLSFAIAKIYAVVRGLDIEVCPCFGPAMPLFLSQSLAVDFVLIMLAIQLWLHKKDLLSLQSRFKVKN